MLPRDPTSLLRVLELSGGLDAPGVAPERAAALRRVARGVADGLGAPPAEQLALLPRRFGEAMGPHGWLWNGFYVLGADGALHLGPAHGPPVCALLEPSGGLFRSGMCFDALLLNQTLAARDVGAWPGYVSCDHASGLATVSGIVAPLRDPAGRPFAVWDLDAAQPVTPADVRFCDALFATLARLVPLAPADLGAAEASARPAGA